MKIDRNGAWWQKFIFNIAYGFSGCCSIPSEVSFCSLTFRFLWMLIIGGPVLTVIGAVIFCILIASVAVFSIPWWVIGLLFASCPGDLILGGLVPIEKWPTIFGWRIYPVSVILAVWIIMNPFATVKIFSSMIEGIAVNTILSQNFWTWSAYIYATIIFLCLINTIRKSEPFVLCKESLQKFCPTVKITKW